MNTMIRFLIATTMITALAGCNSLTASGSVTKDEAQRMSLSEWSEDYCQTNGWYGDGTCDAFCPADDIDCDEGGSEEGGTDEGDDGTDDGADDGTAACRPDDCDVAPAIARICDDGSTAPTACVRADDGECRLSHQCPEDEDDGDGSEDGGTGYTCSSDACGPLPLSALVCEDGSTGEMVCEPTGDDDGECGWVGSCPPSTDACSETECGPAPGAATMCDDGSTGVYECLRADDGQCGYQLVCSCDEGACGPAPGVPSHTCDDGSVAGPRCVAIGDDACGWNVTDCPK